MRLLQLGNWRAWVIGLGAWQLGATSWGWPRNGGQALADAIVGVSIARGVSKLLLGHALRGRRAHAIVATKVFPTHALRHQVLRAADASRSRLGIDTIDLYQVHWPNPIVPVARTMAGMRRLVEAGRVARVGVSNFSLRRWQRAEAAFGSTVISNQVPYHLLARGAERELLPFAQANDRAIIAYSPLAQGLLSRRYGAGTGPRGVRLANPLFTPDNMHRAALVIDALRDVARAHGATPAQIALAWLVRHPNVVAIPGAKSEARAAENAEAADIVLGDAEFAHLDAVSDAFKPALRIRGAGQLLRRLVGV
ncbi:MAG: aldo/keto reductase [SAR202 cluster bacterium]|nr:aldo/keto reductase [SAR202 cluster bacterium]